MPPGPAEYDPPPARRFDDLLASYLNRLRAHLESVKHYPAFARRRRTEGTTTVSIAVTRDGRPAGVRVIRSSGSSVLDEEAEAMVSRAAPFEPLPPELPQPVLTVVVPVSFDLDG